MSLVAPSVARISELLSPSRDEFPAVAPWTEHQLQDAEGPRVAYLAVRPNLPEAAQLLASGPRHELADTPTVRQLAVRCLRGEVVVSGDDYICTFGVEGFPEWFDFGRIAVLA